MAGPKWMGASRERAATSAEYALMIGALAAVVTLVFVAAGPSMERMLHAAWCRVAGSDCERDVPFAGDPWDHPDPVRRATWGSMVVLGDSFSSGEGNERYGALGSDERCHANATAFGPTVAAALGMTDRTSLAACSGATLDALDGRQRRQDPQLDHLDEQTSLVTITMGGNDVGWADVLKECMIDDALASNVDCRIGSDRDRDVDRRIRAMRAELLAGYEDIVDRAPNARVVAVGYPRFFPDPPTDEYTQGEWYLPFPLGTRTMLDEDAQEWINSQTALMNQVTAEAAAEAGIEFVDATDAFDGHELTTDTPWYHGIEYRCCVNPIEPASFHPNVEGQRRMAALVEAQIRRPLQ